MDEPWKHYAKWKKVSHKRQRMVCDPINMKCWIGKSIENESRWVVRVWRQKGMKHPVGRLMKIFWNETVVMDVQLWKKKTTLKSLVLYTLNEWIMVCELYLNTVIFLKNTYRTSLEIQWLGIHLPMQGTQVRPLVQEDPIYLGAAKPKCHNSWALVPRTVLCTRGMKSSPFAPTREKPMHSKDPAQP